MEYVHHGLYKPAKHTELMAQKLMDVEQGKIKRLMIFLPPRHSKSMTGTETFPSFFIGKNPNRRVITVAYGDTLAKRFGRLNKQKINEFGPDLFGLELATDNASVSTWDIQGHRGGMLSVGVGGPVTGQGADLLMIDDIVKNRQEANSQVYRDMVWNEWESTLYTRLHPNGAVVLIMTRWHEDDLAGRLLKQDPDGWEVLSIPCEAEDENDPLGRSIGDPLWAEHGFDKKWMEETKRAVGSSTWASLFQQRPAPAEGDMIKRKWWKFYKGLPPTFDFRCQSWDMAFKDKKDSDFVVGQVWGRRGADFYLLDQVRGQMGLPATLTAVRTLSGKHPLAYAKYVEDKANGPAVIQMLNQQISGLIAVNPEGGKIARVAAVSPVIEAGNVWLPDPSIAPWVHDFIEECAAFPVGKNDDMVDCMTQAIIKMLGSQTQLFV